MTDASGTKIEEGSRVAWNWGNGHVEGTVAQVSNDTLEKNIKGKHITRKGTDDNPALYIERSGNNVLKKASEVHVLDEDEELQKGEKVETARHHN
ncbi:hypothetical protein DFJ77DRAFT_469440 [Powellomyces hirtus]|nr:hypothetical protein DFJ77DRAFT_481652 [Powellomyces hirtus]KAI8911272.1 hypothetical protein DFJ77DRAFT_469440 [Powellomyces hirtus]